MKRGWSIAAVCAAAACWGTGARAQGDPDVFDPVLDAPPAEGGDRPLPSPDVRQAGAWVSTHGGVYLGAVQSYLTSDRSMLRDAARFAVGFGIGVRTPSPIDLGVDVDLGLGQTWEPRIDDTVFAFDLIIEPRVVAHVYETEGFSAYAGVGALSAMFDLELAGINQAGVGPSAVVGLTWRTDGHSQLYLEASGGPFYDLLAYHYRGPTEAELAKDPIVRRIKVEGEWFALFRVTVGYRLTAL